MSKRFGALLVDSLIVGASFAGLFMAGLFVILVVTWGNDHQRDVSLFLLACVLSALAAVFYVFFWTTSGATPGKASSRIRVVGWSTGRPPDLRHALMRYAIYGGGPAVLNLIGFATGSIFGYLGTVWVLVDNVPAFFDPWRRALHDRAANTVVVLDPPAG